MSKLMEVLVNLLAGSSHAVTLQRSKTSVVLTDARSLVYVDLERQARNDAEKAMKVRIILYVNMLFYIIFSCFLIRSL